MILLKYLTSRLYLIAFLLVCFNACSPVDLYEKTKPIPGHAWKSSFVPGFDFTIKDTTVAYELFLVLRHNDKYNYNNIWLNIKVKSPGSDSVISFRADKKLATDEKGWLASGMDDIYEHRISLVKELVENNVSLKKPGDYSFSIAQIMREDPLLHVYDVGLRIEKKN